MSNPGQVDCSLVPGDAVLFTSGPSGASFSAGVIHAWLAVDRKAPLVAAGISMGSISAAAFQRVYREMDATKPDEREQKRWEWYRRYLNAVTNGPNDAIWSAFPDPVDFYASTPPVRDFSLKSLKMPGETKAEELPDEAEMARRHYYLLTKFGTWLANLPIRVSTVATIVVLYVRRKEKYGNPFENVFRFYWNLLKAGAGIWRHLLFDAAWISEAAFKGANRRTLPHPLFGWLWWLLLFCTLSATVLPYAGCVWLVQHTIQWKGVQADLGGLALEIMLLIVGAVLLLNLPEKDPLKDKPSLGKRLFDLVSKEMFTQLDMATALLHSFEVKRQLYDLFIAGAPEKNPAQDVRLLTVCAALEVKEQVCLQEETPLLDALTAATAIPGLFPPKQLPAKFLPFSVRKNNEKLEQFHLIDGAAVRDNPIPAFFEWCKEEAKTERDATIVKRLEETRKPDFALHVVYNVPTSFDGDVSTQPPPVDLDIVGSAQLALQLEKRRDTRQEVRQTNYTSELHAIRRRVTNRPVPGARGPFILSADEIAPLVEIDNGSELNPAHDLLMKTVADGCRATLEVLYQPQIAILANEKGRASCANFLAKNAGRRKPDSNGVLTGLPEVCASCKGILKVRRASVSGEIPEGVIRSFGEPGCTSRTKLSAGFEHLTKEKPKIVFLGAGGVFRGAFHIGVIAAMKVTKLYPDLVIGTSVGALMGGALCHLTAGPEPNENLVLQQLTELFVHVDERVALTRTLKNAAKQLGTRARSIKLSPATLAAMMRGGSQKDPGYASTGAPPALIDALSYLFMIPHNETAKIASQFVAGHIGEATGSFLHQLRKETLASFEIKTACMGVSMLEGQARRLMGEGTEGVNLTTFQPFHDPTEKNDKSKHPVSFFALTSYLNARISLVLGRDFLTVDPTWDAVYAGLSSSAFPAVFAPRVEADFLPGRGKTTRLFADGGMFDNLPFLPAIEILGAAQLTEPTTDSDTLRKLVRDRAHSPNIFIAAGLDAAPSEESETYDTLFKIRRRAASLSVESKLNTFVHGAKKTVEDMKAIGDSDPGSFLDSEKPLLNSSVATAVVRISPTDAKHINPTFAFCAATGLNKQRVERSIADGCFQSLAAFCDRDNNKDVVTALQKRGTAVVRHRTDPARNSGLCPYFCWAPVPQAIPQALACPFAQVAESQEMREVYAICRKDPAHQ